MPDYAPEVRRRVMQSIKASGGRAEISLRKEAWRLGLRFRKHDRTLPGRPDLAFRGARVAIFVDSRFWHGQVADSEIEKMGLYWQGKLRANRARDVRNNSDLTEMGWTVLRFYEDEIEAQCSEIAHQVSAVVKSRSRSRPPPAQSPA